MTRSAPAVLFAALTALPATSQQRDDEPLGSIDRHRDPKAALAEAKAHAASSDTDRAVAVLWRLGARAASIEDATERTGLVETVARELAHARYGRGRRASGAGTCHSARDVPANGR